MNATDYSYCPAFETKVLGMGLKRGMFAFNDNGYIHPITRHLYTMWLAADSGLTAYYVNSLVEGLK